MLVIDYSTWCIAGEDLSSDEDHDVDDEEDDYDNAAPETVPETLPIPNLVNDSHQSK